jgi:hypothetical protein
MLENGIWAQTRPIFAHSISKGSALFHKSLKREMATDSVLVVSWEYSEGCKWNALYDKNKI